MRDSSSTNTAAARSGRTARGWCSSPHPAPPSCRTTGRRREDLAAYRAIWRDPIETSYRGHTIYSMPPASSGGVTMGEILNIMEGYSPLPPFGSVALMHREAEAMRRAFTDRNTYLGDPDFVRNPIERLLSKKYASELRQQIGEQASVTPRFEPGAEAGASTRSEERRGGEECRSR